MSRELLYGNGLVSSRPGQAGAALPAGANVALTDLLTIHARALETDHLGRPRFWLNDPDLASLYRRIQSDFGDALARFVIAFRVFGPAGGAAGRLRPIPNSAGRHRAGQSKRQLSVAV